jgi:hypothetical protein
MEMEEEEASALDHAETKVVGAVTSGHVDINGACGEIHAQSEMGKFRKRRPRHNMMMMVVVEGGIINANPRKATKGLLWSWDMVVSCVKMDFCD